MNFNKIKQFPRCDNQFSVMWNDIPSMLHSINADIDPSFQRAHVWTEDQQSRYIEYRLQGGTSGKDIYFNCKGFDRGSDDTAVLVDGKQRLNALMLFMDNKIKAFDTLFKDFDGAIRMRSGLTFHINTLETNEDVYEWYLGLNGGGTGHTQEELQKVRDLMSSPESPSPHP